MSAASQWPSAGTDRVPRYIWGGAKRDLEYLQLGPAAWVFGLMRAEALAQGSAVTVLKCLIFEQV